MGAARIEAEATRAEGDDLQEPAGHGEVLEEMDELVLIGQLVMEYQRSGNAEGGKA